MTTHMCDLTLSGLSKNLTRPAAQSRFRTLLHHPALDSEQEAQDHLAIFFRDLHEFHANNGPTLPLHDGINNGHTLILQDQNGGSDELAFIEVVVVLRRYQTGPTPSKLVNDGIDVDAVHA